jgi:hypothetical protein
MGGNCRMRSRGVRKGVQREGGTKLGEREEEEGTHKNKGKSGKTRKGNLLSVGYKDLVVVTMKSTILCVVMPLTN